MRYTRMYADASGETHFEDVDVVMAPGPVPPPAIGANFGERQPAAGRCSRRRMKIRIPPKAASSSFPPQREFKAP